MKLNYQTLFNIIIPLSLFLFSSYCVAHEEPCENTILCHSSAIIEKKIEKHSVRFKAEHDMRKRIFSVLLGTSCIINIGNIAQIMYALLPRTKMNTPEHEQKTSFLSIAFYSLFQLFQSALATYVLHKGIHYSFRYYTYEHPITWLLDARLEIRDHFETLLCMIANQEKKIVNGKIDEQVKQYLQLFVKIISKDTRQICAFMKYRSTLFPTYKQPTVTLIQSNILSFLADWICTVDALLVDQPLHLKELSEKTVLFKALLYEQIDLFKKIDNDHGMFREIVTAILQTQ